MNVFHIVEHNTNPHLYVEQVGQLVAKMAASTNLKKTTLELGGKSPIVVMADANSKYCHDTE